MNPVPPAPVLSVLVPVYNTGSFLEPCLHSLAAQQVEDIEFICLDDGSTDGSAEVLDTWAARDNRFRVIYRRDWLLANGIRFSETAGAAFQDLGFAIRTWVAAAIPSPACSDYSSCICITPASAYHYREDNPASSSRKLDEGAWNALHELEAQAGVFETLPHDARTIRSILVRRILHTLQADYRLRISTRVHEFLQAYSDLLNRYFPLQDLNATAFRKQEWHDLQLIYKKPLQYPHRRKGNISILQRIYSCRREAGHRVLRLCGFTIHLSH